MLLVIVVLPMFTRTEKILFWWWLLIDGFKCWLCIMCCTYVSLKNSRAFRYIVGADNVNNVIVAINRLPRDEWGSLMYLIMQQLHDASLLALFTGCGFCFGLFGTFTPMLLLPDLLEFVRQ
jgi:hypothetical protein